MWDENKQKVFQNSRTLGALIILNLMRFFHPKGLFQKDKE